MKNIVTPEIEWTFCFEKTPKDSVDVLLWHKEEDELDDEVFLFDQIVVAYYDEAKKIFFGYNYFGLEGKDGFPVFERPVAWAPIPEPWK